MKRITGGLCSLVLVLGVLVSLWPLPARAADNQEGFNIITSPLPIKLATKPGQTVETELRMKNLSNQPEHIKVGLMKFGATGETGQPNLFDLTPRDTYASWVHFSPQNFIAETNVWKTVKVTINVPSDAGLGYYLAVTFGRASQAGDKQATSVKGAVATLILLDVRNGQEKRDLQLTSFSASHRLYEYLPATFNIKVHNQGNIYLSPVGNIFISRGSKTIDTLNFNEAGGSVLPQSNRVFAIPWKNGFPVFKDRLVNGKPVSGKHGIKQDLKWDFTQIGKFRIGHYTAKLLVVYDNGSQDVPLESTLSFWVIPWKLILALLAVVGLVGFGFYSAGRSAVGKTKKNVSKFKRGKR